MRHQKRGRKLSRSKSHRKAMLSNMAASLIIHKQIKTTEAKAKEVRRVVDRLITYGKKGSTHARRRAFAVLGNKGATGILFEEIAPLYANRQGGYTRLIKLGYRPNDTAKVVLLQLVDFFGEGTKKEKKKASAKESSPKKGKTKKEEVKSEKSAVKEEGKKENTKKVSEKNETPKEPGTAGKKPEKTNAPKKEDEDKSSETGK
ncbi:MAG: 50S ribosomal protein L17 [Fidelibacterota bacterium]